MAAHIQAEIMAASEDARYVVAHFHPLRSGTEAPRFQPSSAQTARCPGQSPIIQICRHRLI